MKINTLLFILITTFSYCQKSIITTDKIHQFDKILIVSQSELSKYRIDGLKKEFKNYGYDINFKNLAKAELSLEVDTVLYNQAIKEFSPQVLFIVEKKGEGKINEFGNSTLFNNYDIWNYEVKDLRTKKTIYKAVFTDFNFKKILKKFESDGLIVKRN